MMLFVIGFDRRELRLTGRFLLIGTGDRPTRRCCG